LSETKRYTTVDMTRWENCIAVPKEQPPPETLRQKDRRDE